MKGEKTVKKITKILFAILAIAVISACLALFVFAGNVPEEEVRDDLPEEDAELVDGAVYEVIAANGKRRSSGTDELGLEEAAENYYDGDTIILLDDVYILGRDKEGNIVEDTTVRPDDEPYRWAVLEIYADEEKTLNFDFNGHGIILYDDNYTSASERLNNTVIVIGKNSVVNFYSSKPRGYIFASSTEKNSAGSYYTAGFAFSAGGNAVVNIGRYEKPDGTVAEGSNFSTSAAGFINFNAQSNARVTVDGGTYYRYSTGSQVGIIAHREGSKATLHMKNANVVCNSRSSAMMIRGVESTTIFENCLLYDLNYTSAHKYDMVHNDGGGVNGKEYYRYTGNIIMRDCVSVYNIPVVSRYPDNYEAGEIGTLSFEGENVFRQDALTEEFQNSYNAYKEGYNHYSGGEPKTVYSGFYEEGKRLARVARGYEVEGNPIYYTPGYSDGEYGYASVAEHKTEPILATPNPLFEGYAFVDADQIVNYKFVTDSGTAFSYDWKKGEKIVPPSSVTLSEKDIDGVFRYEWKYILQNDGSYRVEMKPIADFKILVSYDLYHDFALNVYVEKRIFDTYVDPINCYLGGEVLPSGAGVEVELEIDGQSVKYYKFTKTGISADELSEPIEAQFPLSFWWDAGDGARIEGDGKWSIDMLTYCDKLLADESSCSDAERTMINDMLNYVKRYYELNVEDDSWNDGFYLALNDRIDLDSLTQNTEAYEEALTNGVPEGVLWEAPKSYADDLKKSFYAYAYAVVKAYTPTED